MVGFIDKLAGLGNAIDITGGGGGKQRLGSGNGVESKSRFGQGIGNTPMPISPGVGSGYIGSWGEDRITNISIVVRVFQTIFTFSLLIVAIILATFQNQWIGKISGLTALLLIVIILTFITLLFMLALSFLPASLQNGVDRVIRILEQPRLGLVMNGVGTGIWLILAMTQTISAYTSAGCKDSGKDPHANDSKGKKEDFIKALPSFCTTKKAGAAFCWLLLVATIAMLLLFLRGWRQARKNGPRIPPFVHPADDGAFEPIAGDMDAEADMNDMYARDQTGGFVSNRYGEGGDGRYGYGGYEEGVHGGSYGPQVTSGYSRTDPFADSGLPRQSYDYGAYAPGSASIAADPYAAIQQQLHSERPPQLPPLYRG